jgi:hypothetical protein
MLWPHHKKEVVEEGAAYQEGYDSGLAEFF